MTSAGDGAVPSTPDTPLPVLLVGAQGHGRSHLHHLAARPGNSGIRLAGVCDLQPLDDESLAVARDAFVVRDIDTALERVRPSITVISTPLHTHVDLALRAVRAGSHVLMEKPPAVTLDDYERLVDGIAATGRACQVNFHNNGSHAFPAIQALIDEGAIGELQAVGVAGAWVRDTSYYARSSWAGRRTLDGTPIVDGAFTNPFAHALVAALRIAGAERRGELTDVHTEMFRAHDMEADDTASLRVRTRNGISIVGSVTLCADFPSEPYLLLHGTDGCITFWYTNDTVKVRTPRRTWHRTFGRTDLLDDLVAHLRQGTPLLVPPGRTGAFMEVVEHIRTAGEPVPIDPSFQRVTSNGRYERREVPGIAQATADSAQQLATFSELGVPWSRSTVQG